MAQIYNTDLSKELIRGASIQVNHDLVPNQLAEKVVPVMEVNPKLLKNAICLKSYYKATTSTNAVAFAKINKEMFITAIQVSNVQDATSDNVGIAISGVFEGITLNFYNRRKATTTASNTVDYLTFDPPLKIDKNTDILLSAGFTAGSCISDITFFGYIVENQIN